MAGTLAYTLQIAHVFQRRFDSDDLAAAMRDCHLYLVLRRPAVRLHNNSVQLYSTRLEVDFETRDQEDEAVRSPTRLNIPHDGRISDFQTHADGTYFSMKTTGGLIHGETWALSSFMSKTDPTFAALEVMYIGQAFGQAGSRDAHERTKSHEKLQRIYEDHINSHWQIFVAPLRVTRLERISDDHIDDDEGCAFGLRQEFLASFQGTDGRLLNRSIDLVEHSLISYFLPYYNSNLVKWQPNRPTLAMIAMQEAGFRLLRVQLDGSNGLARFYSAHAPNKNRTHVIHHDFESGLLNQKEAPNRNWRSRLLFEIEPERMINSSEVSDLQLNIFGEHAPKLRTPPTAAYSISQREQQLEEARALFDTLPAESPTFIPSYDPVTGTTETGVDAHGCRVKWSLHAPDRGVCNGLILGAPGMGKTNHLTTVMLQALLTGRFVVWLADPANRSDWKVWRSAGVDWLAPTREECLTVLRAAAQVVDRRNEIGGYINPSSEKPAILLAIEDVHLLLEADSEAVDLLTRIAITGSTAGVGVVATTLDPNIRRFGGSARLRAALAKDSRAVLGGPDSVDMLQLF